MQSIISYIDQYFCDKHTSPSVNEIALGVGIPKTTVFRYLVEMDNRGMIEYDGKSRTIRTAMINKFAPDSAPCPLVGSVPCGSAQTEEENIREYVSLPVSLFGNGKYYILEASGDSMVDAGIDDGDLVVIRTDCNAGIGDIVVALTGDCENTPKVFAGGEVEIMNTYDVKCPICGFVNHSLFLEETDGWMECEHCGHTAKYSWSPQVKKQVPVFVIRELRPQEPTCRFRSHT